MINFQKPWINGNDEDSDLYLVGPEEYPGLVTDPIIKTHCESDADHLVSEWNALLEKVTAYEKANSLRTLNGTIVESDLRARCEMAEKAAERFDFAKHLQRQREWSSKTFGPDPRVNGIVSHIRKELDEILADPTDISEWIDVTILALDGAWRTGYSPEQIIDALVAKQIKNEGRKWPDWKTCKPDTAIEHDRSEDATIEAYHKGEEA